MRSNHFDLVRYLRIIDRCKERMDMDEEILRSLVSTMSYDHPQATLGEIQNVAEDLLIYWNKEQMIEAARASI